MPCLGILIFIEKIILIIVNARYYTGLIKSFNSIEPLISISSRTENLKYSMNFLLSKYKLIIEIFKKKLLSGLVWNVVGTIALQGSNFVAYGILTFLLGLESFGAYILVTSTLLMVSNFAQAGCGFVATKLVAENFKNNPAEVNSILQICSLLTWFTGILATLISFGVADKISGSILNRPDLSNALEIAAISILFNVIIVYQIGTLQGFGAFKELSKVNIFSGGINVIVLVVSANFWGLYGALYGFTIATSIRALICYTYVRSVRSKYGITGKSQILKEHLKVIGKLALPSGLAGLITMPALWLVNLCISHLPNGLILVGIYAIAMQVKQVALQIPVLLNSVAYSLISQEKGVGEDYKKIFFTNIWINSIFGIIITIFIGIFSSHILSMWQINSEDADTTLIVLGLSIVPELLAMSFYQLIQLHGRMWRSLFGIALPRDIMYFSAACYLTSSFNLVGPSLAYFISQILGMILTFIWAFKLQLK